MQRAITVNTSFLNIKFLLFKFIFIVKKKQKIQTKNPPDFKKSICIHIIF